MPRNQARRYAYFVTGQLAARSKVGPRAVYVCRAETGSALTSSGRGLLRAHRQIPQHENSTP